MLMIREATHDDIEAMRKLGEIFVGGGSNLMPSFSDDKAEQILLDLIDEEGGILLVAVEGDEIVGMIGAFEATPFFSDDNTVQELFWYVDEAHRGKVGVKLMRGLEKLAKDRGVGFVSMSCMSHSMELGEFYERLGYQLFEKTYVRRI